MILQLCWASTINGRWATRSYTHGSLVQACTTNGIDRGTQAGSVLPAILPEVLPDLVPNEDAVETVCVLKRSRRL
jgi:hypothetical protein